MHSRVIASFYDSRGRGGLTFHGPEWRGQQKRMDVPVRGLQALRGFASLTVTPQTERWQYQLDGETDEKVEPDAFFFFFFYTKLCFSVKK